MERATQPRSGIRHPMFFGFLFGLLCGIGIALAVALYVNRITSPFQHPAGSPARTEAATPAAKLEPVSAPAASPGKAAAAPETRESVAVTKPKPVAQSGKYFLQVGSFVSEAEADNRKARLALLGLQASVRSASLPDKGTVHRVVLGPYSSMEELDEVKENLKGNGYTSSLITQ